MSCDQHPRDVRRDNPGTDRHCPRCGSPAERIALYGSQLMTSQFRCRHCGALFEGLRSVSEEESEA